MADGDVAKIGNVSERIVRQWRTDRGIAAHGKQGPAPKPRTKAEAITEAPYNASQMTPDQFAARKLEDLAVYKANAAARGSWAAVAQLDKRENDAYAMLQEARRDRDPVDELTDEQLLELVVGALAAMPIEYARHVRDEAERIASPLLTVVETKA